jgi:Lipase C-terminal domain
VATLDVADDGSWGPVRGLRSGKRYEFALLLPGSTVHHLYYEPFKRSDHLVRLLTSQPGGGVNLLIERSPEHSAVTIVRYKEFWGDQGAESDTLAVNGINLLSPATAPIDKRVIGMFAFDVGLDKASDVTVPHPVFFSLPFLSGVDLFIPAATPPEGTVTVSLRSRGAGRTRNLTFPNFPSSTDSVSVGLNDFESTRLP